MIVCHSSRTRRHDQAVAGTNFKDKFRPGNQVRDYIGEDTHL